MECHLHCFQRFFSRLTSFLAKKHVVFWVCNPLKTRRKSTFLDVCYLRAYPISYKMEKSIYNIISNKCQIRSFLLVVAYLYLSCISNSMNADFPALNGACNFIEYLMEKGGGSFLGRCSKFFIWTV